MCPNDCTQSKYDNTMIATKIFKSFGIKELYSFLSMNFTDNKSYKAGGKLRFHIDIWGTSRYHRNILHKTYHKVT